MCKNLIKFASIFLVLLFPVFVYSNSKCSKSLSKGNVVSLIDRRITKTTQDTKRIKLTLNIPPSVWSMDADRSIEALLEDNNNFELPPQINQQSFLSVLAIYGIETVGDLMKEVTAPAVEGRPAPFRLEVDLITEHPLTIERFVHFWYNDLSVEGKKAFIEAFQLVMD